MLKQERLDDLLSTLHFIDELRSRIRGDLPEMMLLLGGDARKLVVCCQGKDQVVHPALGTDLHRNLPGQVH